VKLETADYLDRAREDLSDARQIAQINLAKVAARSAYYAASHAAEALIFEKTGRAVKTHRGVRMEFARLTKDDPRTSEGMAGFLLQAYQYKEISDYGTGSGQTVTLADADALIASAADFVRWVQSALT
jgi:uncharacterized protein (UPF0332 family)